MLVVQDYWDKWCASQENKYTSRNCRLLLNAFAKIGAFDPTTKIDDFASLNFCAIVQDAWLYDEWARSTKQNYIALFSSFINFMRLHTQDSRYWVSWDKSIFRKDRRKVKTIAMTMYELRRIIDKLPSKYELMLLLALQGGRRIGEVLNLRLQYIDLDKKLIIYQCLKKIDHKIIINTDNIIVNKLKYHIKQHGIKDYLFPFGRKENYDHSRPQGYKCVRQAIQLYCPPNFHTHILRTSAITKLFEMDIGIEEIMEVTGHANYNTCKAYDKRINPDNITKQINLLNL